MTNPFTDIEGDAGISPSVIMNAVAETAGVEVDDIICGGRDVTTFRMRATAMMFMQKLSKMSSTKIGAYFGRDHTTVLNAIRQSHMMLEQYPKYKALCAEILEKINDKQNTNS